MTDKPHKPSDPAEEVLRRMLNTPPKPHKPVKPKSKKPKTKKPAK